MFIKSSNGYINANIVLLVNIQKHSDLVWRIVATIGDLLDQTEEIVLYESVDKEWLQGKLEKIMEDKTNG